MKIHTLGAILPLDSFVYFVRPVSRSTDGRRFYSLEIAKAYAAEQAMLTGAEHEIHERLR